jgi:hypothetical protein
METISLLQNKSATIAEALAIFDALDPVDFSFMKGQWKGYEISTGHPIDGLLDASGWYGKLFLSPEEVHPLLFKVKGKPKLFSVNPQFIPLSIPFPKIKALSTVLTLLRPVLQTKKARARMRMVQYRGKLTGAMVYDHKAIIDVFVKIDDNTMLGAMDMKGDAHPYIFVLERDFSDNNLIL